MRNIASEKRYKSINGESLLFPAYWNLAQYGSLTTSHRTSDFAGVAAQGSDNWPTTWSNDDNQYAMWGDGGGFGGTDTDWRSSLGVARIMGDSDNYQGINRYGGKAGECSPTTFDNTSQMYISHTIDGKSHGRPIESGRHALRLDHTSLEQIGLPIVHAL